MLAKIVIKVSERDVKTVKAVLTDLKNNYADLDISAIRRGEFGDDILLSFNVSKKFETIILREMEAQKITIVFPVTDSAKKTSSPSEAQRKPSISTSDSSRKEQQNYHNDYRDVNPIDSLVRSGNYKELIRISKDIRSGNEKMNKAKEGIEAAIQNAIDAAYKKSFQHKEDAGEMLVELIKIATDRTIKALNYEELMKYAGLTAINICAQNEDLVGELVKICNMNTLPYIINIEAAVKLSNVVLNNAEKFPEDADNAVKHLNVRWLSIAYDVVSNLIDEKKQQEFNGLLDYVHAERLKQTLSR